MLKGEQLPQYIAAACISVGAMCAGISTYWTKNIKHDIQSNHLNGIMNITQDQLLWIRASIYLGGTLGCYPIAILADIIGRKMTVLLTVIPYLLGWVVIMFSRNFYLLIFGRIMTGIASGPFCVLVPVYTTEIAPIKVRGRLGTFYSLFQMAGFLYSSLLGLFLPLWMFNIACSLVPILFGIVFSFQPESPVYSVRKEKIDQAKTDLRKLRGEDFDGSTELMVISEQILNVKTQGKTFWAVLKTQPAIRASLICFMLMIYEELTGFTEVVHHVEVIFMDAGARFDPRYCSIILQAAGLLGAVYCVLRIDRIGRRFMLMESAALMALNLYLLAIYFSIKRFEGKEFSIRTFSSIPAIALVFFILTFATGMGSIPFVLCIELFPPEIMLKCSAAAGTLNWFLGFLITLLYRKGEDGLGTDVAFYIFGTLSVTAFFFIAFLLYETTNKTMKQIQLELSE